MDRLIPYSADVYSAIIADHNLNLWPLQIFILVLCACLIGLARRGRSNSAAFMIVAALWVWCGIHFHLMNYTTINWAAQYFGYAFILQGLMIAVWAVITRHQFIEPQRKILVWIGNILIVSAIVLHPSLLILDNTPVSYAEIAGVMPTPTVALTIGVLLLLPKKSALWLIVMPMAWSIWDGLSAWTLGMNLKLALPIICLFGVLIVMMNLIKLPDRGSFSR